MAVGDDRIKVIDGADFVLTMFDPDGLEARRSDYPPCLGPFRLLGLSLYYIFFYAFMSTFFSRLQQTSGIQFILKSNSCWLLGWLEGHGITIS